MHMGQRRRDVDERPPGLTPASITRSAASDQGLSRIISPAASAIVVPISAGRPGVPSPATASAKAGQTAAAVAARRPAGSRRRGKDNSLTSGRAAISAAIRPGS